MRKLILFSILALMLSACTQVSRPETLLLVREGNVLFAKQSYQAAADKYVEALRYDPFQAETHLNLGLSFELLQQADKALQSYQQAEKLAQSPKVKFMALFNQAQLLGKAKKVDEALDLYQRSLEIMPSSKEVKTNIELLIQDQQGGKDGENKDQPQDQQQQQQKQQGDKKDQKDQKDKQDQGEQEKKEDKKQYEQSSKYQPRKFDSKELSESDVKKILGELKQQEQKIRAEFNRKESKEQPRDKDW